MTDITELKAILQIPMGDKSEDLFLQFLIRYTTGIIEEVLDRPNMTLKQRTEYYSGTGTQKLLLRSRPVFINPVPQVFIDWSGYYGTSSGAFQEQGDQQTWGSDFTLMMSPDGQSSRSGILVRINNYWPMPSARQQGLLTPFLAPAFGNIKVIYTAGWTVDTLPIQFRLAAESIVAQLRQMLPYGFDLTSESYEDRSVSYFLPERRKLLAKAWQYLGSYRNWSW